MKLKKSLTSVIASIIAVSSLSVCLPASAQETGIRGDANQNEKTDIRDCAFIARTLAEGKGSSLPADADYNKDNSKNIRDAAELSRDLAAGQVKTYNSQPIISGIHIGMTEEEVFNVVGRNYSFKEKDFLNPNEIEYYYALNNIKEFNLNMSAVMFFEFSEKGKLCNFGYHIGTIWDKNNINNSSYPYSKSELVNAYNKIYAYLKNWYGNGKETDTADPYAIKEYSWYNTDYGDVWFIVGMNLWGDNSGVNEIIISSCNDSLR